MREFVVMLRSGVMYAVKADRVDLDQSSFVMFTTAPNDAGAFDIVALIDAHEVIAVFSRDHLASGDKIEVKPHVVSGDDPIPF